MRAAATSAVLALALTACGGDESDEGKDDKPSASQDAAGDETATDDQADDSEDSGASGDNSALAVGAKADGEHEWKSGDATAKLEITSTKVEQGTNADLVTAGLGKNTEGMYPVFVYFDYTVKEANGVEPDADFNNKATALGPDDKPGKKLIAIGGSAIKGGCPEDEADPNWEVGTSATLCTTFVMTEGTDVEKVAWVGDMRNPVMWDATEALK